MGDEGRDDPAPDAAGGERRDTPVYPPTGEPYDDEVERFGLDADEDDETGGDSGSEAPSIDLRFRRPVRRPIIFPRTQQELDEDALRERPESDHLSRDRAPWRWPDAGGLVAVLLTAQIGVGAGLGEQEAEGLQRATEILEPLSASNDFAAKAALLTKVTESPYRGDPCNAAVAIWISFEDASSEEVARNWEVVRGLAGEVVAALGPGWQVEAEIVDFATPASLPRLGEELVRGALLHAGLALGDSDEVWVRGRRAGFWRWMRRGDYGNAGLHVARYLSTWERRTRTNEIAQAEIPRRSSWSSLLSLAAAVLLLLTWAVPLTWWATLAFFLLAVALEVFTLALFWPPRDRWRVVSRPIPAVVTTLCAIALFGVAYSCLQLGLAGNPLGVPAHPRLGDAALIATSMGIAGGLIDGSLTLGPKIVAHIQLLLFLSALTGAVVAALRSWRRSETPIPEPDEAEER